MLDNCEHVVDEVAVVRDILLPHDLLAAGGQQVLRAVPVSPAGFDLTGAAVVGPGATKRAPSTC